MKVVEAPQNLGPNFQVQTHTESPIKVRVNPSNFSGPYHFKSLYGQCFEKVETEYKYVLCPFKNVTQHEQTLRWNPYSGVLGVWQEWEIVNNTFKSMMMYEGEPCGQLFRSVKIVFKCGSVNNIEKVSEPDTCKYLMEFTTPLVCHNNSMLVYPNMNESLREEWDYLEGQFCNEELTLKGYKRQLDKIFQKAGFLLTHNEKKKIAEKAAEHDKRKESLSNVEFYSIHECTQEYKKMVDEIATLKSRLAAYEGTDITL